MKSSRTAIAVAILGLALSGCANMNNTQSGALAGTGLGAFAGAILGEASGHPGAGALIGAASGAVAGGLIGNAEDAREDRDAAVAQAQYQNAKSRALANAISEADVVTMTRNDVGDEVITNAIRTRGCRWDGTPEAVIRLKHEGVSDRVIAAMQNSGVYMPPPPGTPSGYYYASPPPPGGVVVVGPGYYGPRYWGPRPYYRRW